MVKTELTEGKRASKVPVHHICAPFVLYCQTGKSLQKLHIFILNYTLLFCYCQHNQHIFCCVNKMNENINILLLRDCSYMLFPEKTMWQRHVLRESEWKSKRKIQEAMPSKYIRMYI